MSRLKVMQSFGVQSATVHPLKPADPFQEEILKAKLKQAKSSPPITGLNFSSCQHSERHKTQNSVNQVTF